MPFMDITLNVGRTPEMKERLARRISAAFEEEGFCSASAVSIVFHDVQLHDWVIGGIPVEQRLKATRQSHVLSED